MAAFTAAGTSYATHGEPMVPIYVFYSMFGFQRTGDSIWAAADQMTRGFLIGATAGRTTLTGEGLQHADGHSPLLAATNPAVVSYDPAFAFEIGAHHGGRAAPDVRRRPGERHLLHHGLQRADEPAGRARERRPRGHPAGHAPVRPGHLRRACGDDAPRVQLLASGVGVPWALEAQELLRNDWGVVADVWSVTSWSELRRDGLACDEQRVPAPRRARRRIALRHRSACATPAAPSSPSRTTCARCRTRSSSGCPATSPRSAPTGSASPTPARRRVGSSTSTARRSPCARCRCSSERGEVDGGRRPRGGVALPPARRHRRHVRQRGRRQLTRPRTFTCCTTGMPPAHRERAAYLSGGALGCDPVAAHKDEGMPTNSTDRGAASPSPAPPASSAAPSSPTSPSSGYDVARPRPDAARRVAGDAVRGASTSPTTARSLEALSGGVDEHRPRSTRSCTSRPSRRPG